MDTPEVHHPHRHSHHGGLPRWLELAIAVTALITSISSIAIAVHHSKIMDKLVQANSVPYMQGGFSDVLPDGQQVLSLDLLNRGVGPAHEKSLWVKVGQRYVTSVNDLLATALGVQQAVDAKETLSTLRNSVRTRFIPGGQQQFVFRTTRTPQNAQFWDALKASQTTWDVEYCYCSVFDECWRVPSKWAEPVHIEECKREESREFVP